MTWPSSAFIMRTQFLSIYLFLGAFFSLFMVRSLLAYRAFYDFGCLSDLYDKIPVLWLLYFHLWVIFVAGRIVRWKASNEQREVNIKTATPESTKTKKKKNVVFRFFFLSVVINEQHRMPESASNGFPYCMLRDHLSAIIDVLC